MQLSSLAVLALLTNATTGINLYFQAQAANVPAGTYTTSVVFTWRYAICESGALNLCSWQRSPGVTQNCPAGLCGAPTNWGRGDRHQHRDPGGHQGLRPEQLPERRPGQPGAGQPVHLGDPRHHPDLHQRRGLPGQLRQRPELPGALATHASGANRLGYNIYFPNTTTVWNTTQNLSQKGTGLQQTVNFQVTVDPTQANVPVGTSTT